MGDASGSLALTHLGALGSAPVLAAFILAMASAVFCLRCTEPTWPAESRFRS
jgi:hypothetical protein